MIVHIGWLLACGGVLGASPPVVQDEVWKLRPIVAWESMGGPRQVDLRSPGFSIDGGGRYWSLFRYAPFAVADMEAGKRVSKHEVIHFVELSGNRGLLSDSQLGALKAKGIRAKRLGMNASPFFVSPSGRLTVLCAIGGRSQWGIGEVDLLARPGSPAPVYALPSSNDKGLALGWRPSVLYVGGASLQSLRLLVCQPSPQGKDLSVRLYWVRAVAGRLFPCRDSDLNGSERRFQGRRFTFQKQTGVMFDTPDWTPYCDVPRGRLVLYGRFFDLARGSQRQIDPIQRGASQDLFVLVTGALHSFNPTNFARDLRCLRYDSGRWTDVGPYGFLGLSPNKRFLMLAESAEQGEYAVQPALVKLR